MIVLQTAQLTTVFLIVIRTGTVIFFTPIEAIRLLPLHTRMLVIFILSLLIFMHLSSSIMIKNGIDLPLSALCEFGNGLILSMSIYATFAIFQIVGQLMDSQMGLNAQAILNPTDYSHDSLTGRLMIMLATLFFFTSGGHRQLLAGLTLSFKLIPPGKIAFFDGFSPVIHQFSLMFVLSLMIASPIVFGLLMIDLLAGIMTRNMPQLGTYFIVLPIKILLGLLMLILMLSTIQPAIEKIFNLCFQSWQRILS